MAVITGVVGVAVSTGVLASMGYSMVYGMILEVCLHISGVAGCASVELCTCGGWVAGVW